MLHLNKLPPLISSLKVQYSSEFDKIKCYVQSFMYMRQLTPLYIIHNILVILSIIHLLHAMFSFLYKLWCPYLLCQYFPLHIILIIWLPSMVVLMHWFLLMLHMLGKPLLLSLIFVISCFLCFLAYIFFTWSLKFSSPLLIVISH